VPKRTPNHHHSHPQNDSLIKAMHAHDKPGDHGMPAVFCGKLLATSTIPTRRNTQGLRPKNAYYMLLLPYTVQGVC